MPEAPDDTARLEERLRRLEEENARLIAASGPAEAAGTDTAAPRRGTWWRAVLSATCIVVAAILVPVSIVGAWARVQLVDEDAFVGMLGPLASDAEVQRLVIDQTTRAIDEKVDFAGLTGDVVDGIAGLGLGPAATRALRLLQQPAATGLQNLVDEAVEKVVRSDAFADVWSTAVRGAHRALTTTATSDGGGIVVLTDDGLGVRLGPIVDRVRQRLVDQGVGVARLIPSVDRTIIVGDGSAVTTVRLVYAVAVAAGWWLPLIALALFLLGVLLSRRRSVAVVGSGVALALGGGALAVALTIGAATVGAAATRLKLSPSALSVIYSSVVDEMSRTAVIVAVLGVFVAILGWALGGWSSSRRLRRVIGGLNGGARAALAAHGLDTGRFGRWLSAYRTLVRAVVIALAIVWLLLLRPLSFGDIVLVVVVALLAAWLLELLQRRPEETREAAAPGADEGGEDAASDLTGPGRASDDIAEADAAELPAGDTADRDPVSP